MRSKRYLPKYWFAWMVIGLLWIAAQLPYGLQLFLGKGVGLLFFQLSKKSRRIAAINLQLCFPELLDHERDALLRQNFIAMGIAVFETAIALFGSTKKIQRVKHQIVGLENLANAKAKGKGVVLLGIHFLTVELIGHLFALNQPLTIVYRGNKNPFIHYLIKKLLQRHYAQIIERKNVRGILKALKAGQVVWLTPDIDAGRRDGLFIPFFGIPAATLTAPVRLAKHTDAPVLLSSYYRLDGKKGYLIKLAKEFKNLPTEDIKFDLKQINQAIEIAIREKPEQYLWAYKRFKTRPQNELDLYKII